MKKLIPFILLLAACNSATTITQVDTSVTAPTLSYDPTTTVACLSGTVSAHPDSTDGELVIKNDNFTIKISQDSLGGLKGVYNICAKLQAK